MSHALRSHKDPRYTLGETLRNQHSAEKLKSGQKTGKCRSKKIHTQDLETTTRRLKIGLTFCWTLTKPMLLDLNYNKNGQNNLLQGLKWDIYVYVAQILEICQKMSRYLFSNFLVFVKIVFFKTSILGIQDIKRYAMHHLNAWKKVS